MIKVVYFQAAFAVLAQILAAVIIQITVKAVCLSSAGQHLCRCPMIDKAMQHHVKIDNPSVEEILAVEKETYSFLLS